MTARERLLQFIDYKGISKNKFYLFTGISNGYLDKNVNMGVDKIEIIHSKYPEINLYWLILGIGSMLVDASVCSAENDKTNVVGEPNNICGIAQADDLLKVKDEIITLLKQQNEDLRADKKIFVDLLNSKIFNNQ